MVDQESSDQNQGSSAGQPQSSDPQKGDGQAKGKSVVRGIVVAPPKKASTRKPKKKKAGRAVSAPAKKEASQPAPPTSPKASQGDAPKQQQRQQKRGKEPVKSENRMKEATRKTGPASISGHPAEPKAGKPTAGPSAPQQEKKDQELFRFFSCEPPPGSAQERGITRVPSPPTETPVREPIFTFKAEPVQLSAQPEDSSLAPRKKVTDTTTTTVSQTAEVQQKAQKERRKKSVKDKRRKGSTCSEVAPSGIKGAALMETDSAEGTRPQADISQYTSSSTMWDDRPPRDWPQEWVLEWELYKKEEKYTAWVWKNRMVEYEAKRHSR